MLINYLITFLKIYCFASNLIINFSIIKTIILSYFKLYLMPNLQKKLLIKQKIIAKKIKLILKK